MRFWRAVAVALAIAVAGVAVPALAGPETDHCAVPPALLQDDSPLPNVAKGLRRDKALKIVVLGSSSSLGTAGTTAEAAWPARLQSYLTKQLPGTQIQIVNRSVAGQGIRQMVRRLPADVIAEKPSLVIWQTGTTDAARLVEVDQFASSLVAGVDKLSEAGIDVMLMDPQYSRLTARIINFQPYVDALNQVAGMRDLVVIHRHAIMRHWIESGYFTFADLSREQAAKIADRVYDCLGDIIATVILAKVK